MKGSVITVRILLTLVLAFTLMASAPLASGNEIAQESEATIQTDLPPAEEPGQDPPQESQNPAEPEEPAPEIPPEGNPEAAPDPESTPVPTVEPEPGGEPAPEIPPVETPESAPESDPTPEPAVEPEPDEEATVEPAEPPVEEPGPESGEEPPRPPSEEPAEGALPQYRKGKKIQDRYIVVYKPGVSAAGRRNAIRRTVEADGGQVQFFYSRALNGFSAYLPGPALRAVRADPAVAYVEADALVQIMDEKAGDGAGGDEDERMIQANPGWGLDRVDQRDRPIDDNYFYPYGAANVHVYVIDTGINTIHLEFGGRATADFDSVGGSGEDCHGHGTHVSGIIGGSTYGAAKSARLHGIRVLDCYGFGSVSTLLAGMDYVAANLQKPAVVNMSIGGDASPSIDAATQELIDLGALVVAAAGNSNDNACLYSPARAPAALTVGATAEDDSRSFYSNYGSCLDLFAPGDNILSAWVGGNKATHTMSGTSMAAPLVSGAAALYLQANPASWPAGVTYAINRSATTGKVSDPAGSINRLLYTLLWDLDALEPAGEITSTRPEYSWTSVPGAASYELQVWSGSTKVLDLTRSSAYCMGDECSAQLWKLLNAGFYQWRVRPYTGGAWMAWSGFRGFSVNSTPQANSPSGQVTLIRPKYQWSRIDSASRYQIEVYHGWTKVLDLTRTDAYCSGETCEDTLWKMLSAGDYRWRVRADVNGGWKSWSSLVDFSVSTTPAALSPSGRIMDSTPAYSWTNIESANLYQIEVWHEDMRVMNIYRTDLYCGSASCSDTPLYTLNPKRYTWRVRARVNSSWKNWSGFTSFRVV